MRKSILSFVLLLSAMMLSATPSVTITVDNVTNTTITCSFTKNSDCASYYIVASEPKNVDPWIGSPYAAPTIEETIEKWGIKYTKNDTYTWIKMKPNTMYVIYVTAKSSAGTRVLCTDTLYTERGGGHGESVITISATNETDKGATTKATPNDQTMLFKDAVMNKYVEDSIYAYYLAIDSATALANTRDSLFSMLKDYGETQYEEDEWVWTNLDSGTDYLFVAAGMNTDSVWGDMVITYFKTTGEPPVAVENVEMNSVTVYPNPATDYIIIDGVEAGEAIQVIDLRGNVLVETTDTHISLNGLVPGVYLLRTATSVNKFIVR